MTTILVTGGAGFIGSNFIPLYIKNNPNTHIINIDKLTYAGNLKNTTAFKTYSNYTFIKGDICNKELISSVFKKYNIQAVIHFAAESHVDNSIKNPHPFIKTNIEGTFNLLEAAKEHWLQAPHQPKPTFKNSRFHQISTDEVYGSLGKEGYFTETTPYAPNSPYSASKAASDFLVKSYFHTYGLNVVVSNCSNNYGPKQHDEKLIPTIIRKALKNEKIPIYGDGENIRDWLYVSDHCEAIECVFKKGKAGETYAIGGNCEKTNIDIANTICEVLDETEPRKNRSYKELITFVKDRPGHDFRYAIDASKIKKELNWKPKETFKSGIQKTLHWYLKKYT